MDFQLENLARSNSNVLCSDATSKNTVCFAIPKFVILQDEALKANISAMSLESFLRQSIPVFVNSFNQTTYLSDTLEWFSENGFCNICVLDNASDSSLLVNYYGSPEFADKAKLWELNANLGPRGALELAQESLGPRAPFIFTDPDLWLPNRPNSDMISQMFELGQKYQCLKVGLALDISNPGQFREYADGRTVLGWEKRFWRNEVEADVYRAAVDTTFFLHVPNGGLEKPLSTYGRKQARVPALRMAGVGYLAKHRPWYDNDGQLPGEHEFYISRASTAASWARSDLTPQKDDRQSD